MEKLKVALAQISPVWLNKKKTTKKVVDYIQKASKKGAQLVVFGEGLLPGYPFWLSCTNGSEFESMVQKELFAYYASQAVVIERGDLTAICEAARMYSISIYLGIIERPMDRGGHSLYCSLVYISSEGKIKSVHRKLQPTYEERLVWSPGDGNGLVVHPLKDFVVGGLNCWENWMPMARTSLYAQGENIHVAVWPGSERNTRDITPFIAKESRSYVISVSSLFAIKDIPKETPHYATIIERMEAMPANGGSCISGPDGNWIIEPIVEKEGVFIGELSLERVYEERQNFDPSGHYSRPDVLQLHLNNERLSVMKK